MQPNRSTALPLLLALTAAGLTAACSGDDGDSSGSGGAGGSSGQGGQGGGALACLDEATYSEAFTLLDPDLCVVARYDAPFVVGFDDDFRETAPSWGRHGGPLTLAQNGTEFALSRWEAPTSAQGSLGLKHEQGPIGANIAPELAPEMLFLNAQAVDLPFGGWTAIGWADFGSPKGELLLIGETGIDLRFPMAGLYSVAGLAGAEKNRVLTSSFSALGGMGSAVGLFANDLCGSTPCNDGLVLIDEEGDASGPVTTDSAGNVFSVFPTIATGKQTIVAYASTTIAPGSTASPGVELASLDGTGTSIAALAPSENADGLLLFQPAQDFVPGDVLAIRYRTTDAGGLEASGAATSALAPKTSGTDVRLMVDDRERIWASMRRTSSSTDSVFFLLARRPAR